MDPAQPRTAAPVTPPVERRTAAGTKPSAAEIDAAPAAAQAPLSGDAARQTFLMEIRKAKAMFYNTVVAQAQKIDFGSDRVTFAFLPAHRILGEQVEQNRPWLEQIAGAVAGRKMTVGAAQSEAAVDALPPPGSSVAASKPADLKTTAMTDSAVQAMLDVFPAEIENVEEIE